MSAGVPDFPLHMAVNTPKRGRDPRTNSAAQQPPKKRRQTIDTTTVALPNDLFNNMNNNGLDQNTWSNMPSPIYSTGTNSETQSALDDALNMATWNTNFNNMGPLMSPIDAVSVTSDLMPQEWYSNAPLQSYPNQSPSMPNGDDDDLDMAFEMNTDMGLVLRPTAASRSPMSAPGYGMPAMSPGSPSQWLEGTAPIPAHPPHRNIPRYDPSPQQAPNDGLGNLGERTSERAASFNKTLQALSRLEGSLQADARQQMNMVDDERRAGCF